MNSADKHIELVRLLLLSSQFPRIRHVRRLQKKLNNCAVDSTIVYESTLEPKSYRLWHLKMFLISFVKACDVPLRSGFFWAAQWQCWQNNWKWILPNKRREKLLSVKKRKKCNMRHSNEDVFRLLSIRARALKCHNEDFTSWVSNLKMTFQFLILSDSFNIDLTLISNESLESPDCAWNIAQVNNCNR